MQKSIHFICVHAVLWDIYCEGYSNLQDQTTGWMAGGVLRNVQVVRYFQSGQKNGIGKCNIKLNLSTTVIYLHCRKNELISFLES